MPPLTLAVALLAASVALVQGEILCHYEGKTYPAGTDVPTGEKCLTCQCGSRGGAPVCRLQVCPQLPVPPPKGCVLVHRRDECCQRLICENGHTHYSAQIESRIGSVDLDLEPELTALGAEDRGCVVNGTRYAEGSAMSSSTLCEYCYCVRGKQQCVKPQCEMPLKGCTPKYRALTCCPVSYDCSPNKNGVVSTTATPHKSSGCFIEGNHHKDGMQVRSLARKCEHCYCLRGVVRCVKLECAPPLLGCEPVFAEGKCCPVQYNCSKIMTEPLHQERSSGNSSIFLQLSDGVQSLNSLSAIDLRKHREMKNETEEETDTKTEPFEILKRIENEGAAILKSSTSAPSTTAPTTTTTTKSSTEKPASPTTKATQKPTTQQVTTKLATTSVPKTTQAPRPNTTAAPPSSTLQTSTTTTEKSEEVADPIPAESRIDVDLTTETFDTTTTYPPELETTTMPEDDSLLNAFAFEILFKSSPPAPVPTTTTEISPAAQKSTSPPNTTSKTTTSTTTTTTTTSTPPTSIVPPVMSERVDVVLDELDDTTIHLLELMHKEAAAATSTTTTPRVTLPPLIEALINAKNSEDVTMENEYGEALPPSLPNITMIPFLPEDAVVEKKDGGVELLLSGKQHESSTQFGGSGVPVVGAIPPKRFSPPSSFVGGFLPRQPSLDEPALMVHPGGAAPDEVLTSLHSSNSPQLISITTSTPDAESPTSEAAGAASTTTKDVPLGSHIQVASGSKACIAPDGREVKHGDLLAPPGPCEVCRCDHGTVLCQEELECMKLIKGSENEVQKRVDSPTAASSPNAASVALPPENKIIKDEFSLDSVFKFLFEAPPTELSGAQPTPAATLPRPVRPPPARPVRPKEPAASNSIVGVLKLAGCNIYGRMYRVGRIISELSDQCRECKCTELGVECQPLYC